MSGPIICGLLGELYGWSWGFGAAGVGMLLGLVMFVWLKPWLLGKGEPPAPAQLRAPVAAGLSQEWIIYLGAALGVVAIWLVIRYAELLGYALLGFAALTVLYIVWRTMKTLGKIDRDRMFAALFLIGWEVPASMFQSVNSVFIILLAPLFALLWTILDKRRLEPSSPAKFGIGLILCGAGFLVLVAGAAMAGENLTPVLFVFLIYLFHTMAELCFSPVGLSAMTRLSVPSMVGLVMGTWFLAMAAGNFIAGLIARATGSGDAGGVTQVLDVYSRIGWFAIVVGGLVLLVSPYVKRLMHLDLIASEDKP